MSEFEFEFINESKRLNLKRLEVAGKMDVTMPTLKSKLNNPSKLTFGDAKALVTMGFKRKMFDKLFN